MFLKYLIIIGRIPKIIRDEKKMVSSSYKKDNKNKLKQLKTEKKGTVKKIKYEKNTGKVEKQLKKTLKPKSLFIYIQLLNVILNVWLSPRDLIWLLLRY